jgi:hypothetical protein
MGRNKITFCKGHTINKGRVLTPEHKEKIRVGILKAATNGRAIGHPKGMTVWNKGMSKANGDPLTYGIPCSEEKKKKIALSNTGHVTSEATKKKLSEIVRKWWKNPENAKRALTINSPNKQEIKLKGILDLMYPGEWRFVGNGQVIIDGKCPDFINVNGKKKIIELYGERWHQNHDPRDRVNAFKPFGYDTLVIWVHELQNSSKVKLTIKQFCESRQ